MDNSAQAKAEWAKGLLEDSRFRGLIEDVEHDLIRELVNSKPDQGKEREVCYFQLRLLGHLVQRLANYYTEVELAKHNEELKAKNFGIA